MPDTSRRSRSDFARVPSTGVYTLTRDPRFTVATYCECTRSGCLFRWAVYLDHGYGPESQSLHATLAEAKAHLHRATFYGVFGTAAAECVHHPELD